MRPKDGNKKNRKRVLDENDSKNR